MPRKRAETGSLKRCRTGQYLGQGIANIIKTVDPDAIIVGGEITRSWDLVAEKILQEVKSRGFFGQYGDTSILPTSLTGYPALLGAASLCIRKFFYGRPRHEMTDTVDIMTSDLIDGEIVAGVDTLGTEAFNITGWYLGRLIANIVAAFDPEAVILFGGLMNAVDLLVVPTRRSFEKHALAIARGRVRILVSVLNDGRAAILGASRLVRDALLEKCP